MKFSKWMTLPVVLASALGLVYCGRPILQPSQSNVSETDAKLQLELRTTKSRYVRAQLEDVRRALEPVEAVLRDLGKVIDLRINDGENESIKPGKAMTKALDRLDSELREASRGLVERSPTGWYIDRKSPLADIEGCKNSRVRVEGVRWDFDQYGMSLHGETIALLASGCSSTDLIPIAQITLMADGERRVEFTAEAFAIHHTEVLDIKSKTCELTQKDGVNNLVCQPFQIKSDKHTMNVSQLNVSENKGDVTAFVHANLKHAERGLLGTADMTIVPNQAANIHVCTKGESCVE